MNYLFKFKYRGCRPHEGYSMFDADSDVNALQYCREKFPDCFALDSPCDKSLYRWETVTHTSYTPVSI